MATADFGRLLKTSMGLDAASIGFSGIDRAVRQRQSACDLEDRGDYWAHVSTRRGELQSLIEAVVVPETWFFRDRDAFTMLARIGQAESLRGPGTRVLRLLSLPSSTGEEPYSMAMTLLDAGVRPDRFHIDAVDISARALEQAKRAVYGRNSFRGQDLSFRDRHFDATTDGYRLKDIARQQVSFRQANLLAPDFLPGLHTYDVVFCRNLLIYFDRSTQDRAVRVLERLLTPEGTLFVAPAETPVLLWHAFESAKVPMAFAFRKATLTPAPSPVRVPGMERCSRRPAAPPVHPPSVPRQTLGEAPETISLRPDAPVGAGDDGAADSLERAVQLADQGRYVDAAAICQAHLRRHGPSAQAFYLMAVVREADGHQSDASDFYRKALYLDPDHHESLVHFALLIEHQGNAARAHRLRDRARRSAGATA